MQVNTSLLDSVFTLGQRDRLALDYANSKIFVWHPNIGVATTRLRDIVPKVQALMAETPFEALPTNHLLNLSHNIHVVNRALESYNSKLSSYFILNLVDKVLMVTTLNTFRLTYKLLPEEELCTATKRRLDKESDSKERLLATLPLVSKYILESKQSIPVSLETSFKSFTRISTIQFPELAGEQKSHVLVLANRFKLWHSSLGVYVQAFHSIINTPQEELENLKAIFLQRLQSLQYGPELIAHKRELVDLIMYAVFNGTPLFKSNQLPEYVGQLLTQLSAVEVISDNYEEVLKLTLSILYWEASKERPDASLPWINRLFHEYGFEIDFTKFPSQYRLPFLQKFTRVNIYIEKQVHKACHAIHEQLSDEEKTIFYPLVMRWDDIAQLSYPVVFGMAKYYSDPKEKPHPSISSSLLQRISRYQPKMNRNQLSAVLGLTKNIGWSGFTMSDILGNFFLSKFMESISDTDDLISDHTKFMLEVCFRAAKSDLKWLSEDNPSQSDQEVIKKILQQINISGAKDLAPELIHGNYSLTEIFKEDPDRYMPTANEEQFETFYGPKEKNIKVNINHLSLSIGNAVEVPSLPVGVHADIEECLAMFRQINFTQPNQPDYVNPQTLKDDDESISVESLFGGLRQLIIGMKSKTLAHAPRDQREKDKFYRNMTLYLQHSIVVLRSRPAGDRSAYLIPLAAAGIHCGSKTFETLQDMYYKLTGANQVIDGDTLEGGLLKLLAARRSEILKSETLKALHRKYGAARIGWQVDVHILGMVFKTVGKRFNVLEAEAHQFNDGALDHFRGVIDFQAKDEQDALFENCLKAYTPTVIINELYQNIEGIAGHPKTIKLEFRGLIDEWYKEAIVKHSKGYFSKGKDPALVLSEDVYHPHTFRIKRAQLIYLLERVGHILEKPTWKNLWGRL